MRGLMILGLLVALMSAAAAATVEDLDRLLAQHADHTSASGTFTQRTTRHDDDPSATSTVHAGRFYLQRPAAYDLTFTKPGDDEWLLRLVSDGTQQATVEQIFADQDPDVSVRPVDDDGMGQRLASLMRFERAAIEESFSMRLEALPVGLRIHLTPRDTDVASRLGELAVDLGADGRVEAIQLADPQGNRTAITITELVYDAALPAGVFTWPTP